MCTQSISADSKTVSSTLVEVKMIWNQARHNAFTDLIHWNGKFYCAFREGEKHAGDVGKIRILVSQDANQWSSVSLLDSSSPALLEMEGWDLRDSHFAVMPDGRLMIVGGVYKGGISGTFASFSSDGTLFSAPQKIADPPWWLWRVMWRDNTCCGFAYDKISANRRYINNLLKSTDGINFSMHVPDAIHRGGQSSETAIRFDADGNAYALNRRNDVSALLGKSSGDLTEWKWYDLGSSFNGFGGPNLIETPHGWIGGGRMHDGGANMSLTYIDIEHPSMHRILRLPSGGDCSYPGFVWHDNLLYVSYYSSHEGKTSIYLAKVKIKD